MPGNRFEQLLVFMQFICPKPLRCILYNLAKAKVASKEPFDFHRFLLSEKTLLDYLVKTNRISQSQYHRIFQIDGKSNINALEVLSLVMLLTLLFREELTVDQTNAIDCIKKRYFRLFRWTVDNSKKVKTDYFARTLTELEEATLTLANHADKTGDLRRKIKKFIAQTKSNQLPKASSYVDTWYMEVSTFQQQVDEVEEQYPEYNEKTEALAMEEHVGDDRILDDNVNVAGKDDFNSCRIISDSCHRMETTENDKQGREHVDKKEVKHFKLPLTQWPRLHHSHELVRTFVSYCNELENKLELPRTNTQEVYIDNVDIFVRDKDFDMTCLSADPNEFLGKDSECIRYGMMNRFSGILIDSDGIRLVDKVSEDTLHVKTDINMENECHNRETNISNLIEVAVFEPLFEKIELLQVLINGSLRYVKEDSSHTEVQEATASEILYDRCKTSATSQTEGMGHADGNDLKLNQTVLRNIRKNKTQIDRLLGEMIALTNRSTLSESLRPVVEGYQTKELSKQVTESLFKLHPTIKWCGYRYSTLHIILEQISDSSENDRCEEAIKAFLTRNDIKDYRIFDGGKIKEYKYVGAKIQSETKRKATLGCSSVLEKGKEQFVCGLVSKHLVLGTSKIFSDDEIHFGTVIPCTNVEDGGQDIAAARILKRHIEELDMSFKNSENQTRPAYLYDHTDNKMLQDQPVYLRGAMTKLGVGTIHIPMLQCSDDIDMAYIQIRDGNYALQMPFGRLAVKGDSGSILCMDELGTKNVCVISMLMGEISPTREEGERLYCTLRLSHGLKYLEDKTKGKFTLGGTLSGTEIVDRILWELVKRLPIKTTETNDRDKANPVESMTRSDIDKKAFTYSIPIKTTEIGNGEETKSVKNVSGSNIDVSASTHSLPMKTAETCKRKEAKRVQNIERSDIDVSASIVWSLAIKATETGKEEDANLVQNSVISDIDETASTGLLPIKTTDIEDGGEGKSVQNVLRSAIELPTSTESIPIKTAETGNGEDAKLVKNVKRSDIDVSDSTDIPFKTTETVHGAEATPVKIEDISEKEEPACTDSLPIKTAETGNGEDAKSFQNVQRSDVSDSIDFHIERTETVDGDEVKLIKIEKISESDIDATAPTYSFLIKTIATGDGGEANTARNVFLSEKDVSASKDSLPIKKTKTGDGGEANSDQNEERSDTDVTKSTDYFPIRTTETGDGDDARPFKIEERSDIDVTASTDSLPIKTTETGDEEEVK